MNRRILIASIILFLSSGFFAPGQERPASTLPVRARSAAVPSERNEPNSKLAHEQLVAKAKAGGIDLYFLGDSITRRWGCSDPQWKQNLDNWTKNFYGWNAADFGWGADGIQNILWRIQNGELDGVNPMVIVILAGTNNVGKQPGGEEKIADIVDGIRALVDTCREKAPNAKIILTAIFPRNDSLATWPEIQQINQRIERLADEKTVFYINTNDKLASPEGVLFEGMTVDKLHPTPKAYQIWADALEPLLTRFLGPRAATDHAPPPTADPSIAAKRAAPAAAATAPSGAITYVDATDGPNGNTVMSAGQTGPVGDGVPWKTSEKDAADHLWRKRAALGMSASATTAPAVAAGSPAPTIDTSGGSVYESTGLAKPADDVPRLKTAIGGLAPATYDVYLYFWSDQNHSPWQIRAGLKDSAAPLPLFVGESSPAGEPPPNVVAQDGSGRKLFQAHLGRSTGTSISVYVEDAPAESGNDRTWYDGIGYAPAGESENSR